LKEITNEYKLTQIKDENPFYERKTLDLTKINSLGHDNNKKNCKNSTQNVLSFCKFKNNCDPKAECIYNSSSYKYFCKCFIGYIGNGYKCYGKL
jgi:hypothetical protein